MKYVPSYKTVFPSLITLVIIVTVTSAHINKPNASFHTFDEFLQPPSFSPILSLPPPRTLTGSTSSRPLVSSAPNFQDCLNVTCKGIPAFTPAFNECLRECFSGAKRSTGGILPLSSIGLPSPSSSSAISIPLPPKEDAPYCIDLGGGKTPDRSLCAPPLTQGATLFPSRRSLSKPIDDLIAEFLGVSPQPLPTLPPPAPAPAHDPLNVLTALYTTFQRLPEFLKLITESQLITGAAMDQAYLGYRDARLELLNARTQCADFYQAPGKTPCTVALRSSVYALGKIRISIEPLLRQDIAISMRVADLFKDLTAQWDRSNPPPPRVQPSLEKVPSQPYLK